MAIIGYTAGVFDMFHIGHLNLLRRARAACDHLIVGVTTDDLCERTKGKRPVIPFAERLEIVASIKMVSEALPQTSLDKFEAWHRLRFDRMFVGSDWKGSARWAQYEHDLKTVGVDVVYFPYTVHTSSTLLRRALEDIDRTAQGNRPPAVGGPTG